MKGKNYLKVAWLGGVHGNRERAIVKHYDDEGVAITIIKDERHIAHGFDFVLVSTEYGGNSRNAAQARCDQLDIPCIGVPTDWARASNVLRQQGFFAARDRAKERIEREHPPEITKPMKIEPPYTPPPPERIPVPALTLKSQAGSALLDVLNAASDDEVERALKQRALVRAKQKAQGIVDALVGADDDVLVALAITLPPLVRNKVVGILRDAA